MNELHRAVDETSLIRRFLLAVPTVDTEGISVAAIARTVGLSRPTVHSVLEGEVTS